uniref:BESS domain-containing protein n=1 Tax=Rhodnius prolixus TaxID=13249 RepID=A0A4P6DH54_RHOPR
MDLIDSDQDMLSDLTESILLELPAVPSSEPVNDEQNEVNQQRLKLRKIPDIKIVEEEECDDMLFLRSVLPYMSNLPLVQKLKLRGEINAAVMRACGKKNEKEEHDQKEVSRSSS